MNAYWLDHKQFLLAVRQLASDHNQIRMEQVWNLHDMMRCSMLMWRSVPMETPRTCFSHTSVLESRSRPWEDRGALHCAYLQVIGVLDVGLRGRPGQVGEVGGMLHHQRNSLPAVTQAYQSLRCIVHFLNRTEGRDGQTVFTEQQANSKACAAFMGVNGQHRFCWYLWHYAGKITVISYQAITNKQSKKHRKIRSTLKSKADFFFFRFQRSTA